MNKMEWNKITIDEETGYVENLPEEGEYIFSFKDGTVGVYELCCDYDGWYFDDGTDISEATAWMPMPEPPKEKSDEREAL